MSTSCEFARSPVEWRLVSCTSRADIWMTFTPGTVRSTSPMFVAPVVSSMEAEITDVVIGESTARTSVRRPTGRCDPRTITFSLSV